MPDDNTIILGPLSDVVASLNSHNMGLSAASLIKDVIKQIRAEELAGYDVVKVNNNKFELTKKSDGNKYIVEKKGSTWRCSCPGFKYNGKCKHLLIIADQLPKRYPMHLINEMLPEFHRIFDPIGKWEIVGSYRRRRADFKDIDILITCSPGEFGSILPILQQDPDYKETMSGSDIIRGKYHGYDLDITRVNADEYIFYLLYRTGGKAENIMMRGIAKAKGWRLNEHGLFDEKGNSIPCSTEKDIYDALGIPYKEPWERAT